MTFNIQPHTLPIAARPPQPWSRTIYTVVFFVLFNFGAVMINASQFLFLLPLRLLPFTWSRDLYDEGIRYTKSAFGCLLILMCQWFAPTKLMITFETEGMGKLDRDSIDSIVSRDGRGDALWLNLPTKFVLIGNHQIYADWWYAWCLTYFIGPRGVHRHVYITLKKSLQWVPIVGWGMQFFDFIFLRRSWASDRAHLTSQLDNLGKVAEKEDRPLCFILYPEGTLVSKDTRPISKKYADKMGIPDLRNVLLPRSTGLHYSLRSLAPRIPELKLIDLTVVYPGIPPMGYGQSYYTLRSIFFDGVAPPAIHIHIRIFDVAKEVPIGKISPAVPSVSGQAVDIPEEDKQEFDGWLHQLWKSKDDYMTTFFAAEDGSGDAVEIPLQLRRWREILDSFCFFGPAAFGYIWGRIRR